MSDFRIKISNTSGYIEEELDWDREQKRWSFSDKEGQMWVQEQIPQSKCLKDLYKFFKISSKHVEESTVINLSPGELALIHSNNAKPVSLYAHLCDLCGKHWDVYRCEDEKKQWCIYGRDCVFSWKRGRELNQDEIDVLKHLRGSSGNPQSPPK